MRILIFGAEGFIGSYLVAALQNTHTIFSATRKIPKNRQTIYVDLMNRESIARAIETSAPDVIINCAGIVDMSKDVSMNTAFTTNIIEEAIKSGRKFKKIIVMGSAAEYGLVDRSDMPVKETHQLMPLSDYGLSKIKETEVALRYRSEYKIPVIVARIFNPIGVGMNPKFLIFRILEQIEQIKRGAADQIVVNRLDATRDYVSIKDVVEALRLLIENPCKYEIYNVGSGKETSNRELIDLVLEHSKMIVRPEIVEASQDQEPSVASWADIQRMKDEFGWSPKESLETSVKEIISGTFS